VQPALNLNFGGTGNRNLDGHFRWWNLRADYAYCDINADSVRFRLTEQYIRSHEQTPSN
jgi:hypothetical protein